MTTNSDPLYDRAAAEALSRRETDRRRADAEKFELLTDAVGACHRLVDIGCGGGQLLARLRGRVDELWGVDESPDRLRQTQAACPSARPVCCRADRLDLPADHFDVAVVSQVLHEVKLFGTEGELHRVLCGIRRVLVPGGRCLLLDHADAGEGEVGARLPAALIDRLAEFERTYRYAAVTHQDLGDGAIRITRRGLQDFLTKVWALGTAMEPIEMNETHNVFVEPDLVAVVEAAGFTDCDWRPFRDIRADLADAGGELIHGAPWSRKFLMIAERPAKRDA